MSDSLKSNFRQILAKKGVKINFEIGEVELRYKRKYPIGEDLSKTKITSSQDAEHIFRNSFSDGQIDHREYFKVMYLSRSNMVLGVTEISSGGVAGTVADPKLIFQGALIANASSVILCHNHPSGNLKPSQGDINLTKKCKEGGTFLELPVLDHVILAPEKGSYFSFADECML